MNPHARRDPYTPEEAGVICIDTAKRALAELSIWPGYEVSPLRGADELAQSLGIGAVYFKDESRRFGLGSFKALGGAYAAGLAFDGRRSRSDTPVFCCATDGNHGRSVAYGARRYGGRCVIFVHQTVSGHKIVEMQALGAEVIRIAGNYDDSVDFAKRKAQEEGWILISDTSDHPLDGVAAHVMQGYGVMALEIIEQLDGRLPTHVFMQAGVGGFAAAIAGCFAELMGADRPQIIVVEPIASACVMQAAIHRRRVRIAGDLETNMGMLSCGQASAPAWAILDRRVDAFMTVSDPAAQEAATCLSQLRGLPPGWATTPSGAAGFAGLKSAMENPEAQTRLTLGRASRVLLFATEAP